MSLERVHTILKLEKLERDVKHDWPIPRFILIPHKTSLRSVRSEPPEEPATAPRHWCRSKVGHSDEDIYKT